LPATCDGSEPPTWQLAGSFGGMSTDIVFDGVRVRAEELSATATVGHFATPRLGWAVSAGGITGGSIEGRDLAGGAALGVTLSWLPVYERARRPFVGATASLSTALASATSDDGSSRLWSAWDLRVGAMVGKTFAGRLVPYVAARAFGGPVFWRRGGARVVGGDRYHVTAGAGLTVRLPPRVDLSVEVMPLGGRSAVAGVTWHL